MEEVFTTALKRLVRVKITDGPHETPEILEDGIPFISVEAIVDGKIDFAKKRGCISQEAHELYSKKAKPQFGDLFIVKSGSTTGKIGIVETKEEFNIWSPLALVRTNELVNNKLLYYYLQSPAFKLQIQQNWSFGTQPNIGMSKIEQLRITLPKSKIRQQEIVSYLDSQSEKINRFIQKKEQFIALLKEQRQSIINEKLKIKSAERKLKYCVKKVGSGVTPRGGAEVYQDEGVMLLRSQNVHNDGLRLNDVAYISEEINSEMKGSQVQFNDVLINITGASIGRCFIFNRTEKANVNQHVCILRPILEVILPEFLMLQIQSERIQHEINMVEGASREGLTNQEIKDFPLFVPSIEEQRQIVAHIKSETQTIDIAIGKTEREIGLMKEYKEALVGEAVTGRVRV